MISAFFLYLYIYHISEIEQLNRKIDRLSLLIQSQYSEKSPETPATVAFHAIESLGTTRDIRFAEDPSGLSIFSVEQVAQMRSSKLKECDFVLIMTPIFQDLFREQNL